MVEFFEKGQNSEQKMDSKDLEKLVLLAQKGDMDAFAKLYDNLVQKVYRYIFYKVPRDEAFDLTENVFLKVWENLNKYSARKGSSFSAWVFRIAHNCVVDFYRFNKETVELEPNLVDQNQVSDPKQNTEKNLSSDNLKIALSKLKKNYREVLTLAYLNDLSNVEIAQVLKKSEGSLRVLKHRALQELKKILEEMNLKF